MNYHFAVITGATSGIGAAFAGVLPAETNLLLTGRSEQKLAAAKASLSRPGRQVETVVADLATDGGRQRMVDAMAALPVDLLVNNAGFGHLGPSMCNDPAVEREMIEINVTAAVVLTRAVLPAMLKLSASTGRRCGVIAVSSLAAFQPMPYLATYGAAKSFVLSYFEALACELEGLPVSVVALCPGRTDTGFFERAGISRTKLRSLVPAERVAREGLDALGRKTVHVVGAYNRLRSLLVRHAPRSLATRLAARALRRYLDQGSGRN
jgi:short-subunit dehydrogenase